MTRGWLIIFGVVALAALLLALGFGADRLATGMARGASAPQAAPVPLERPARAGEARMRDASSFALRASEDFT